MRYLKLYFCVRCADILFDWLKAVEGVVARPSRGLFEVTHTKILQRIAAALLAEAELNGGPACFSHDNVSDNILGVPQQRALILANSQPCHWRLAIP